MNRNLIAVGLVVFVSGVVLGRGFTSKSRLDAYREANPIQSAMFEYAEIGDGSAPYKAVKVLSTKYETAPDKFEFAKTTETASWVDEGQKKLRIFGTVNGRQVTLFLEMLPNQTPE